MEPILPKQIKNEECELGEDEGQSILENWEMDNDKRERFLCLLGIIRMDRDHIFGDYKKLASDGTIVTPSSKKLATDKVAQATFDLGFTNRVLDCREWKPKFWNGWKNTAKRQKEKRLKEGGAPLPWEILILDICGINRDEPGIGPALIKWSAVLNGCGVHNADSSLTNQSIQSDPRFEEERPSTSNGLSYESLVQQLHHDEEERQCQLFGVAPLERENRLESPPPEHFLLLPPSQKRRREDDSPTPSVTYMNQNACNPTEMLAKTQALLNLLEAIPKAKELGYDVAPQLLQGYLVPREEL